MTVANLSQESHQNQQSERKRIYYQSHRAEILFKQKQHRQAHPEYQVHYRAAHKDKHAKDQKELWQSLYHQIFVIFGEPKIGHAYGVCTCCHEADLEDFGTLSHVNNDGAQHRKRVNQYAILKEAIASRDRTRFAAECFNCNLGARKHGGACPHKNREVST